MINYVIYERNVFGYIECIVEVLDERKEEILSVQQELTSKGYIILELYGGRFIKCRKVKE